MNINRELAGLLGLCWHEYDHWEGRKQVCRCGKELWYFDAPVEWGNPDFTSSDGKIELLRLMMKHLSEKDFREFNSVISCCESAGVCILTDYITDTTGLLAQAARDYLRRGRDERKELPVL
jgi:hypothetical protein